MKKVLRVSTIIVLSISILLSLCSCRMEESYIEFHIKNIPDHLNEDCFTSEELAFARLQGVLLIPEVKAVNHGEYVIYIIAYSRNGKETVQITKVIFKEQEAVLLNNEVDAELEFRQKSESIYEGGIDGGRFTEKDLKIADGKEYDLVVEAEIIKDDTRVSEHLTFHIVIKGYKSFVFPT